METQEKSKIIIRQVIIFVLLIIVMGTLVNPSTVSASTGDGELVGISTRQLSEKEIIKNLQSKPNSQLRKMGYNDSDIKKIKATTFQASESYGQVTYTIAYYKNSFKYSRKKKRTYIKTKMTWNWNRPPRIQLTDIPGMTTSERFVKTSASSKVKYRAYGALTKPKERYIRKTVKTNAARQGVYVKVNMDKWFRGSGGYFAKGGYIISNWVVGRNINVTGLALNYGHATYTLSPSISFSKHVESGDEASTLAKR